jgi:hypothetical protein
MEQLASVIGHADCVMSLHDYCAGLLLPGERLPTRTSKRLSTRCKFFTDSELVRRLGRSCCSASTITGALLGLARITSAQKPEQRVR